MCERVQRRQLEPDAVEAEGRRRARFFRLGHTQGTMVVPATDPSARSTDFPCTLDLRTVSQPKAAT